MMGKTHAATGVAAWLVGCGVAATQGVDIGVHHVLLGAGLTAYGAVLPDIDMPRSNVALSLGWPTRILATIIARFGAWFHATTRLPKDRRDEDGHRTITHTLLFCAAVTAAVGALGRYGGLWAPLVFVLVAVATAARSLLAPSKRQSRVRVKKIFGKGSRTVRMSKPVMFGLAATGVMWMWPPPSGWWLGVAVGGGCLVHNLGDSMTNTGVPLWFPWEVDGKRWHCVRVPEPFRFETKSGSRVEWWIHAGSGLSSTAALALVFFFAWPEAFTAAWQWGTVAVQALREP